MADDTDEHEFQIEGQTLQTSPAASSRSPSPADEEDIHEEAQRKLDLQKVADDKLLSDADIAVDGMSEEEKQHILWALRESMPAAPPRAHTPSSSSLSPDITASDNKADANEKEEKIAEDDIAPSIEDPASEESNDHLCDSSTSAALPKTRKVRSRKTRQSDADSASELEKLEVGLTRRTRRQRKKCTRSGSDVDTGSSASENSENGEEIQTCSLHKLKSGQGDSMKLSTRQKRLSQSRFKDLLNKTNLSLSQQSAGSQVSLLSPIKEGSGPKFSQDLFMDDLSEEEASAQTQSQQVMRDDSDSNLSDVMTKASSPDSALVTSPRQKKQRSKLSTPSPIQVLTEDSDSSGNGVIGSMKSLPQSQEMDVDDDEAETQPPEEVLMVEDEEEEVEEGAEAEARNNRDQEDEDEGRVSPIYPVQVPQTSCSSPQSQSQDRLTGRISPSKLASVDDKDKRPLLHDNWFSWPHVPPICQLQRSYRSLPKNRKETPHDIMPYCCPKMDSPVQISEEMLKVFDAYFPYFTSIQHCFEELPWGKPVRSGCHLPDTLDVRKRGGRAFYLDEDDLDDFRNGQPPAGKVTSVEGPKKRNLGLCRNVRVSTRKGEDVEDEEDMGADAGNGGVVKSWFEGETQPYDTDEELPDIQITTDRADNATSGDQEDKNEEDVPSHTPGSRGGSQSSNSMLNEQGELYSAQLPHRKRRAEARDEEVTHREGRSKRLCTQSVHSSRQQEQDVDCNPEPCQPLLIRKRKQAALSPSSNNAGTQIYVSGDDDDEVSFPHQKKINTGVSERGIFPISSTKGTDSPSVSQSPGLKRKKNRSGGQQPVKALSDMGDAPFRPIKREVSELLTDFKGGECGADGSDDSVQFVDPDSMAETAIVERRITETATIEKKVTELGTQERRVTETVERKVTETAERRILVQPQASRGAGTVDEEVVGVASTSHSQPSVEMANEEEEEKVACPLCNLEFPIKIIEQHASDCPGEIEEPEPPQLRSASASNQLKRRPLHGEMKRQEFVCNICQLNLGGSGALKRHFDKCWQQEEASSTSANLPAPPKDEGHSVSTRSSNKWLDNYQIPRKVKNVPKRRNQDVQLTITEETEQDIEECSDDSSKDPDFALTKDDKRQEKEDARDDGLDEENDPELATFRPVPKLANSPVDIHNQSTRKPRKRPSKSKDKQL